MVHLHIWTVLIIFVAINYAQTASRAGHGNIRVYDYHVTIDGGDSRFLDDVSQFMLTSKLVVIEKTFGTIFQLKKVRFGSYNGNLSYRSIPESQYSRLDHPIHLAFSAKRNRHGQFEQVMFMRDEPKWLKNVKKGIVSLLNVPTFSKDELDKRVFERKEEDIYGDCQSSYVVDQRNSTNYRLLKVQSYVEDTDSRHFDYIENRDRLYCNMEPSKSRRFETERSFEYWFEKQGDGFKVASVTAESLLHAYLSKNTDVFQYFRTIQKLNQPDLDFNDFTVEFKAETFEEKEPLEFNLLRTPKQPGSLRNMLLTSLNIRLERKSVDDAIQLLKSTAEEYENLVEFKNYGLISSAKLEKILWYLRNFKVEQLTRVYETLRRIDDEQHKTTYEFFLDLIGQVGTDDSALFIIAQLQKDSNAVKKLIPELAMNWIEPSDHVLAQVVNELLKRDDPMFIRAVSIILGHTSHEYKNYTELIFEKLRTTKTHEKQLTYLFALNNIFTENVIEKLLPIALGKSEYLDYSFSRQLQEHAVEIIGRIARENSEKEIIDAMLSLVTNSDMHLEIRIAAMKIIFDSGSEVDLQDLATYMKSQRYASKHLYNYYFKSLKNAVTFESLCNPNTEFIDFANKEMKYFNNAPESTATTHLEYMEKHQTGEVSIEIDLIANETTNEVHLLNIRNVMSNGDYVLSDHEFHIRFEGNGDIFHYFLQDKSPFAEFLRRYLGEMPNNRQNHTSQIMEFVYVRNGRVITNIFINDTKGWDSNAWKEFKEKEYPYLMKYFLQSTYEELTVPTDFGLYAQSVYMTPTSHQILDKENALDYRFWMRDMQTFKMFNPFLNATLGSTQFLTVDVDLSMHLNYSTAKNMSLEFGLLDHKTSGMRIEKDMGTFIIFENVFELNSNEKLFESYHLVQERLKASGKENKILRQMLDGGLEKLFFNCNGKQLYSARDVRGGSDISNLLLPLNCDLSAIQRPHNNNVKHILTYKIDTIQGRNQRQTYNTFNPVKQTHVLDIHLRWMKNNSIIDAKQLTPSMVLQFNHTDNTMLTSLDLYMVGVCVNYTKTYGLKNVTGEIQIRTGLSPKVCFNNRETIGKIHWVGSASNRSIHGKDDCLPHNSWNEQDKHKLTLDCILAWTELDTFKYTIEIPDKSSGLSAPEMIMNNFVLKGFTKEDEYTQAGYWQAKRNEKNMLINISINEDLHWATVRRGNHIVEYSRDPNEGLFWADSSPHMGYLWNMMRQYGLLHNYVILPSIKDKETFSPVTSHTQQKIFEAADDYQTFLTNGSSLKVYWRLKAKKDENNEMVLKIDFGSKGYLVLSPPSSKERTSKIEVDRHLSNYIYESETDAVKYYGLTMTEIKDKTVIYLPKLSAIIIYDKQSIQVLIADYFANFHGRFVE